MTAPQDQFPHGGYDDYDNNNNHEDYNDGHNEWNDYNNNEGYNEWNDGNYNDEPNGGNGGGYNNNNYQHVRGVDSHFRPTIMNNPSPIIPPQHQGQHFEIRPQYLAIIPSFRGFASDEPYTHLQEFSAICSTIGSQGFTTDEVKLYLFQFSLKDKAKQWFTSLPSGSIRTWVEMQQIFLDEYYPMSKTSEARNAIKSFSQHVGEELHEAFTRFKEMLRFLAFGLKPFCSLQPFDLKPFCSLQPSIFQPKMKSIATKMKKKMMRVKMKKKMKSTVISAFEN